MMPSKTGVCVKNFLAFTLLLSFGAVLLSQAIEVFPFYQSILAPGRGLRIFIGEGFDVSEVNEAILKIPPKYLVGLRTLRFSKNKPLSIRLEDGYDNFNTSATYNCISKMVTMYDSVSELNLWHELGHHVACMNITPYQMGAFATLYERQKRFYTTYGIDDVKEAFANDFACYHLNFPISTYLVRGGSNQYGVLEFPEGCRDLILTPKLKSFFEAI